MSCFLIHDCFAQKDSQKIGNILMFFLAYSVSCFFNFNSQIGVKVVPSVASIAAPVGVVASKSTPPFFTGIPCNELSSGRRRYREFTMIAYYKSTSKFNSGNMNSIYI
jgi:hypothetical protein